ncbi:putative secreted protein [Rhodopirellula maiorica SM1]|uniref:Putative secreted protein n=1 Tax=Rhodopirellula maiorica SM1 TaxID=1265738 RepID=M5RMM6_9BACT|nr:hypothetical protein [Rhodopirellula maiorica]EMI20560.1 putative secreted protein [Rhodopirellula maiorica SM1]
MKRKPNSGIILLVVLSMLTFFSLLVAAYLVFSNQSRATAFAIASTKTRAPEPNKLLDDAMMRLLVGTGDDSLSFFGEDLLSDYYGRSDARQFDVASGGGQIGTSGFVRVRVQVTGSSDRDVDDLFAGRVITFQGGPLVNRSYRVIRSLNPSASTHDLVIELEPEFLTTTVSAGTKIWMNGTPRNSPGLGYQGGQVSVTQPTPYTNETGTMWNVGFTLPLAMQPNLLGTDTTKIGLPGTPTGSDFDEGYDAADFNNWFLSHRHADGTIIPSFHRPSVINYILNEYDDWESSSSGSGPRSAGDYADLMASIARATFRPLPIAENQFRKSGQSHQAINSEFTGGNSSFALRRTIRVTNEKLVDQVARALIQGEWDVDNDADGVNDSIWVNLGLPLFTAPDGKLLRPLVAPMIEDLSGRLNVNAHHNSSYTSATMLGVSSSVPRWAGNYNLTTAQAAFRGLGYGPAEIALPITGLDALVNARYRNPAMNSAVTKPTPGFDTNDYLDLLRTGNRPPMHTAAGGYGYSTDPFGRGGVGIGLSGHLVAGRSGTQVRADDTTTTNHNELTNEFINDPYESDPSGLLSGDLMLTTDELEAILRSNEFDIEMLPTRLRTVVEPLLAANPGLARAITTHSKSDDTPPPVSFTNATAGDSLYESLLTLFPSPFTEVETNRLLAPELRLGRKISVNRPLGNGFDDNGNGVIDEPIEVAAETDAFTDTTHVTGDLPSGLSAFDNKTPDYNFDEPSTVDSRQLLARHLYVLMMVLTNGAADFPDSNDAALPGYKAHRIAQWAVNVVDYRDPDSIMTAFEYDADPFDGWGVDGNLLTDESTTAPNADGVDNDEDGTMDGMDPDGEFATSTVPRGVVWGVESPELVFSESFASHDVRLRDTNRDGNLDTTKTDPTNPDPDSDQVRIPQGSLMLELYCPRPTVNTAPTSATALGDQTTLPGAPQELYTTNANAQSALNLALTAPSAGAGVGAPVWRIAITERHDNAAVVPAAKKNENPATLRGTNPDTASFQIETPDELNSTAGALSYDRFIVFPNYADATTNPAGALAQVDTMITNNGISDMAANQVFFAPTTGGLSTVNATKTLEAGQYLCLAPRIETRFGSKEYPVSVFPGIPSEQRFSVNAAEGLLQARHDGTRLTPSLGVAATDAYSNALSLVIAAPRPTPTYWTGGGVNVFDQNVVGLNVSEPLPNGGSYYPEPLNPYNGTEDLDMAGGVDYPRNDAYLDFSDASTSALDTPLDVSIGRVPVDSTGAEPALGTRPEYCSAFLQRLADPTRAYNAVTNPYRTIDWIPIDLTVFSGEERESKISSDGAQYARRTRQRNGFTKSPSGTVAASNALYSYETDFPTPATTVDPAAADYFAFSTTAADAHLYSSFSVLNTDITNFNPGFVGFAATIGSDASATAITGHDRGLPSIPFAVHPWLNRPFTTPMELMMVPACSQGRLFEEFNITSGDPTVYPNSATVVSAEMRAPFRHMLNFFHSQDATNDGTNVDRIFDFVHTLPPFRGEVDMIPPARVTATGLVEMMKPPFNMVYDNQRQARINLNTLSESLVWQGLMQGHLTSAMGVGQMAFDDFIQSRRGYPVSLSASERKTVDTSGSAATGPYNYIPSHLDPELPTQFAGVFRDWRRANFAPALRTPPDDTADTAATDRLRRNPIDGTLLRRHYSMTTSGTEETITADPYPQFVRTSTAAPLSTHLDRGRNPFVRYQTLMRMPNLASDNSQVFLVRLTMGFFEVDPSNVNSLGREYKEAIGENQRYQAMFIIDRSIPVGFVPGQEMNARNTVIFERFYQ